MKVLRIISKKLREVLALLKLLDAEFRKIKRQTMLAACLFPLPLTVVIVHAKLDYDVLLMFVMEFGFFLVLPIVLGIIASILFRMESENGTLKTLSVIPVPRWKLLGAKVIVIYILAIFYGVAAIGATMIGGFFTGNVSNILLNLAISLIMSVLIATATLPVIAVTVILIATGVKICCKLTTLNFILPTLCSVIYAIVSFVFSIMMLKVPAPLTLLFRCSLPYITATPERIESVESVQNWVLPVFPCIIALIGIGIVCMALSAHFYQKQEV